MKIALLTMAGLAAACAAQTSGFVQFDSDATGAVPNGFVSVDSPLVSFSDIGVGGLQIGTFGGGQTDGPSLVNFAETPIRLTFARPVTNLAMLMGDDDSGFVGGADVFTKIVGFRDGAAVSTLLIQNNGDDIINDGPQIEGIFDAVEVEFTDGSGVPHPNLPEIIDSVSFAVADEFVDFDSGGGTDFPPNGFRPGESSLIFFSTIDGMSLFQNGTGKTDGISLINNGSGPITMDFDRPVTEFSCQVGNDDGAFVGGPVYSTLRGYLNGVLTETVIFQNNANDLMDDGPAIRGVFDRIEFTFTNAAGVVDNNLAEIIDNIAFATASQHIDFESDSTGPVPNGFKSNDSPLVGFGDTDGSGMQITDFNTNKSDGQSLVIFSDDDSSLRMQFDALVSTFTLEFGNDDPSRDPVFATLRGYNNGSQTRAVTVPTPSDNAINQSMSIAGSFDAIEFQYTNMDGSPITNGLTEIVDNIRFSAEKQFIDFNDDPTGAQPNGFMSNDSNLVSFRDSMGAADLRIQAFSGNQSDGPGLGVFGDDASALRMPFVTPVNSLSVMFGNDTASQSTRLRGFLGNVQVAESIVAHDGDDELNQTVTINGFFDRAELVYINNSDGLPSNRIEIVDNICFDVATGATPCSGADLAAPFGILDLSDINAFVTAFTGMTSGGDLDQNGIFDLTDINLFVTAFTGGCP
jgi:hypothetical protein